MRTLFFVIVLFIAFNAKAQTDSLFFHNGNVVAGQVLRVGEYTISYKYSGEEAEHVAGRYAIEKIRYKSSRTEHVSEKIVINGEDEWRKVLILEDKSQIAGLQRNSDISGFTAFINLHTPNTGDEKALEKLKREAAEKKCPFIYLNFDRETKFSGFVIGLGASQYKKTGIAYSY
jgi:hypothetical protein